MDTPSIVFPDARILRRLGFCIALVAGVPAFALTPQTINATPNAQNAYTGQTVYFSAAGASTIYAWTGVSWSSGGNASMSWSTPGTYTVKVQAPGNSAYAASSTVSLTVNVISPQAQAITATPLTQKAYTGQTVYFAASGSNTGYQWTGATGIGINNAASASMSWSTPGTYTITVKAPQTTMTGQYAASNVVTLTVNVLSAQAQAITATPSTQNAYTGQTVYFTASGGNTNYSWSGANPTNGWGGPSASMSWSTPGTRTVTVQAMASSGTGQYAVSNVVTLTVNVLSAQAQAITATPSTQNAYTGQTVYFTASGGNTNYSWSGANPTNGWGGPSASMSWSTPGARTVTVQAMASSGTGQYAASNVVTLTVNVVSPQTQTISATPSSQTVAINQQCLFFATGGNTNYSWTGANPTNGWGSQSASMSWSTPGTYTVTVQALQSSSIGQYAASNVVSLSVTVVASSGTLLGSPGIQTIEVFPGQVTYFSTSLYCAWSGVTSTSGNSASSSWTAPGSYTVLAQNGNQTVSWNVNVLAPVAQTIGAAGDGQIVYAGQTAYFSACGSNTSYSWTGATAGSTWGTASALWKTPGTYTVSVQAPGSGAYAASNTVSMTVTVLQPQAQTISAAGDGQTVYAGQMAYFSASGSNTGYTWTGAKAGSTYGTASGSWTTPGTYTVTVQAPASGNVYAASNTVSMTVTVLQPQAQTISAAADGQTVYAGQMAYFSASGSNTGYTWTGAKAGSTYGTASGSWPSFGLEIVTVKAPASGTLYAASDSVSLTTNVIGPQAQTIVAVPATQTVLAGQTAYFSATGSNTGYNWSGATPISGSSSASHVWSAPGVYAVTVQAPASGTTYGASKPATLLVTVVPANVTGSTGTSAAADLATRDDQPMLEAGDPVQTATGAQTAKRVLMSLRGARNLLFSVSYNSILASAQTTPGVLGCGWSFPYEASVAPSGSNLIVNWDSTHNNTFTPVQGSTGTYSSAEEGAKYVVVRANSGGGWAVTKPNQASLVFDSTGRLLEDLDRNGRKLLMGYNGAGQLSSITEPISGAAIGLAYDGAGHLSGISDANGVAVNLAHDANAQLTSIEDQNSKVLTYGYDGARNLTQETDNAQTRIFSNTFDSLGRNIAQQDGVSGHGAYQTSYQPGGLSDNIVSTITDKTGKTWTYTFDPSYHPLSCTDPLGRTTSCAYDALGNRTSYTDPLGATTQYVYDAAGNLTSLTDPKGGVTSYTYDARNNLLTATDPLGNTVSRTYDANNNLLTLTDAAGRDTSWTYDQNSMPLTKTLPDGGVFNYTYAGGRLVKVVDPDGVSTQFSYDSDGRLLSTRDANGNTTTRTYDAAGNLLTVTDALGQTETRTYDYRNRLVSITGYDGAVTSYTYDNNDNVLSTTDPGGGVTTRAYDAGDRLLSVTDPLGNVASWSYDPASEPVSKTDATGAVTTYQYDSSGRLTSVTDPLGDTTSYSYDPRGLLTSVTDPLGRRTSYAYDDAGRRISATDPLNETTSFAYDEDGRLTLRIDGGGLKNTWAYDGEGNLASFTDGNGNATTLARDGSGRLTAVTTPLGRVASYSYDSRGLLATRVSPSGQMTAFSYDADGRLAGTADAVGSIAITRDPMGRMLTETENGKVLARSYDGLGRMTRFTDASGNSVGYAYDRAGNLSALTYPDGKAVGYTYDAVGRMLSVTDWAGRTTGYGYDAADRLTSTKRPNGTSQLRTYDAAGQLTNLTELASDGVTVIYSTSATFDADGRLSTDSVTPEVAAPSASQTAETFNADNQITSVGGGSTTLDADGDLLSIPGTNLGTLSYDGRDRLVAAGTLSYSYDSENHRVGLADSSGTTTFVVDPSPRYSQVLVWTPPTGAPTRYVYGLGLLYQDTNGAASYYHYNRRGDTVALSDDSSTILGQVQYGPYGEVLSSTLASAPPFLFNGLYGAAMDSNGLVNLRARYYSPVIRSFLSQDWLEGRVGSGSDLNRYAYAGGDPVNRIDPLGLQEAPPELPDPEPEPDAVPAPGTEEPPHFVPNTELRSTNDPPDPFASVTPSPPAWQAALDSLLPKPSGNCPTAAPGTPNPPINPAAENKAAPIWSATKDLSAEENAAAHAAKHAGEFPELAPGEYTSAAQKFVSDPPAGALTKVQPNGDTLIYDPATNTFAVRAANGAPRTMFRPTDGANYWRRQ